ncbi:hypothetical protein APE_0685 [Aeropyrum pernix K1]|uniref:Uncharacterized protein n=1 Tax=Aeropyrum pernix (strain ATCC 700893 / DSM 11879 / JCM 9820 / NBRC 100138 / K1) TaxID=272557 RepID=Q9YE85_AERPE|nr:hypothetical protein [Aeropyrum pernix]3P1Z_A Chain A, Crystal structure of the Aperopyrum pernix RNA splicing endonuclease [Aeropyrum pernix]3P1Z_C Chain C, Crystal structure of the Aperopyrum pernix RNA splicing endonuclease [Aeropyrum pernix]3P1Z_E Chain E, Crystal structure of the Aperopyrum pernix RNA splicing endonuclease [Aeropyrum pernix]3P1Z_G Chain G, Crystal structure of the Aperopyrum pernix RNA splicing endonuclease [Aeropyrum pernix]3P1Z_I Chain I, Crystal structure of the Ape
MGKGEGEVAGCKAAARLGVEGVFVEECFDGSYCRNLERIGYLRKGRLEPLEAAYQASRGMLCMGETRGWAAAVEVIAGLGLSLDTALVYFDLRRKGRKPLVGVRRGTLVYEHGGRVYEVLVLSEGYPLKIGSLVEWSRGASMDNHSPIVAIVDRTGLITYYEARAVRSIQ